MHRRIGRKFSQRVDVQEHLLNMNNLVKCRSGLIVTAFPLLYKI